MYNVGADPAGGTGKGLVVPQTVRGEKPIIAVDGT
jgi:hypothetical protein